MDSPEGVFRSQREAERCPRTLASEGCREVPLEPSLRERKRGAVGP